MMGKFSVSVMPNNGTAPDRSDVAEELQQMQARLEALQMAFKDHPLAYHILGLAREALHMSWYAVQQPNSSGNLKKDLEEFMARIAEQQKTKGKHPSC